MENSLSLNFKEFPQTALALQGRGGVKLLSISADGCLVIEAGVNVDEVARQFLCALEEVIKQRITGFDASQCVGRKGGEGTGLAK